MDISNIFSSVLEISIISSIIGIIIILIRQLLKSKVNSKWIYIIWFILLFKLLVPIKIESFVSIFNFAPEYMTENNYIENSKIEYESLQKEYNNYINDNIEESNNIVNNQDSYELKQLEQEIKKSKIKNNIFEYIIPTIWMIGTIIMILWLIITNIVLNSKLNKNCYKDERLENILEKCKNKMNVKRKFHIVINNIISTPALFGILKVKILIPKETIVKYKIYSVNENGNNALYKEAVRMINGSYYLSELPIIKGEYIVEVYISFSTLSNNYANYCLKYKT